MSLEKEALEYLGYKAEDFKTVDEFKTKFDSTFIKQSNITEDSEPVKKILGKTFGTLENEIKKVAKGFELDIDFDDESIKGKKVTDKLKFTFEKYNEKKGEYIKELETKASLGNDEKIKEWEKKYEKTAQKAKDYEALLNSTKSEFQQAQEKWTNEVKNVKLNVLTKDAFGKVKLKSDISDFEKRGYMATIAEKYKFDLDETENLVVKNSKGERIPSAKTTGTFKTIEEILEEEAIAGKLVQLNPDGGKAKPPVNFGTPAKPDAVPVRKVAPRLG
jgi:hypothetical protein